MKVIDTKISIRVRVTPGAKREYIRVGKQGELHIAVKDKAKEGRANSRVKELIAGYFKVPERKVTIVRGILASSKTVHVFLPSLARKNDGLTFPSLR